MIQKSKSIKEYNIKTSSCFCSPVTQSFYLLHRKQRGNLFLITLPEMCTNSSILCIVQILFNWSITYIKVHTSVNFHTLDTFVPSALRSRNIISWTPSCPLQCPFQSLHPSTVSIILTARFFYLYTFYVGGNLDS